MVFIHVYIILLTLFCIAWLISFIIGYFIKEIHTIKNNLVSIEEIQVELYLYNEITPVFKVIRLPLEYPIPSVNDVFSLGDTERYRVLSIVHMTQYHEIIDNVTIYPIRFLVERF